MKKLVYSALLAAMIFPATVFATGAYLGGYVFVNPASGFMSGAWNNRYSTVVTPFTTYIYAVYSIGSSVSVGGRDDAGNTFSCFIPPASALYKDAVQLVNGLTNGVLITVNKNLATNECIQLSASHDSRRLD
ncbi:MAG TPA: hypothetical protein VFX02_00480 [Gammaproteobacteria bacterium]|nr:hypothetical protein [Gammaproteobacteria bacterium]